MATPTLPAQWTPTQQGCLRSTDYWIWEYNAKAQDARTVLGGPTQTSACLPPTWDATGTYAGTACPTSYTSACQGPGPQEAVTCCPDAYNFGCQSPTWSPGIHAETFRCSSAWTGTDLINVTRTDFVLNTVIFEQISKFTNRHLFALAVLYTTPATKTADGQATDGGFAPVVQTSAPTVSTEPTLLADSSAGSARGLSPSQAAGIGVGSVLGALLVAITAWFLYRLRERRRTHAMIEDGSSQAVKSHPLISQSASILPIMPQAVASPPELASSNDSYNSTPELNGHGKAPVTPRYEAWGNPLSESGGTAIHELPSRWGRLSATRKWDT
ncbi:hypothetical protein F4779DRAFT_316659 [Xylariaceae sp. FL0662B]|nr:hypothetical protein F4779DRAFT_316659 [Xylariaceae sp. FL0662B]